MLNKQMNGTLKNILWIITYAIVLIAILLRFDEVIALIAQFFTILRPFMYGFAIAYIFNIPMTFFLKKLPSSLKKGRKLLAALLSFMVITVIIGFIFNIVVPQFIDSIQSFMEAFPSYVTHTQELVMEYLNEYANQEDILQQLSLYSDQIQGYVSELLQNLLPALIHTTKGITTSLANIFLSLVIAVYMIVSKKTLLSQAKHFAYAFLPDKKFQYGYHVYQLTNRIFSKFISGQLMEAVIIGVLCYIGCLILGIPYAPIVSVIVGCTNIIPIFGPIIGIAISSVLILFVAPLKAVVFIIFGICLQQFESNLIYPKVVGSSVGLGGLWVLLAVAVGGGLFGLVGMVLGLPTFAVGYTLIREEMVKRIAKKTENSIPKPSVSSKE